MQRAQHLFVRPAATTRPAPRILAICTANLPVTPVAFENQDGFVGSQFSAVLEREATRIRQGWESPRRSHRPGYRGLESTVLAARRCARPSRRTAVAARRRTPAYHPPGVQPRPPRTRSAVRAGSHSASRWPAACRQVSAPQHGHVRSPHSRPGWAPGSVQTEVASREYAAPATFISHVPSDGPSRK